MDKSFWHQRWETREIAFHENEVNPLLLKYFDALSLKSGSRIFLPLCGKTRDIHWLLSMGYCVAGAELSNLATEELFNELDIEPEITCMDQIKHYKGKNIDIFQGDFFNLSRGMLGPVDAIYDRAALVALPQNLRNHYSAHLTDITDYAAQLLICYEYDQIRMEGPPFSISEEEIIYHYGDCYSLTFLEGVEVSGGLKGQITSKESVWILKK